MPPKHKVSRDEILAAAWSLLEEKGHNAVTTRAIAEKLGLSSRPVYSFFDSMDGIFSALESMAADIVQEYMQRPYTEDPFLNMGVGYVCFVIEKPRVSDFLELKWAKEKMIISDKRIFSAFYESFRNRDGYREIPEDEFFATYRRISIYTYGFVQYLRASLKDMSVDEIITDLRETGEALFVHYFWKKMGKPVAEK
jgi:AcrR family transcriptional regulator